LGCMQWIVSGKQEGRKTTVKSGGTRSNKTPKPMQSEPMATKKGSGGRQAKYHEIGRGESRGFLSRSTTNRGGEEGKEGERKAEARGKLFRKTEK